MSITKQDLKNLPKVVENIIKEYTYQLIHAEKLAKVLKEMDNTWKYECYNDDLSFRTNISIGNGIVYTLYGRELEVDTYGMYSRWLN